MAALATPIVNAAKITVDAAKLVGRGDTKKRDMLLIYGKTETE
jgi:hypothetical protein